MPIRAGGNAIEAIRHGATVIVAVSVGSVQVWPASETTPPSPGAWTSPALGAPFRADPDSLVWLHLEVLLPTALHTETQLYLTQLQFFASGVGGGRPYWLVRVTTAPNTTSGNAGQQDLVVSWETHDMALTVEAGGLSITFPGPVSRTDDTNFAQDQTEPYDWTEDLGVDPTPQEVDDFTIAFSNLTPAQQAAATVTLRW